MYPILGFYMIRRDVFPGVSGGRYNRYYPQVNLTQSYPAATGRISCICLAFQPDDLEPAALHGIETIISSNEYMERESRLRKLLQGA